MHSVYLNLRVVLLFSMQMWACALGHLEAAVVLYKWDRRALAIPDSLGRLPLSIARSRGHTKLAECLEQLQREEQQPPGPLPPTTRMSFSPAPDSATTDSWMASWASDSIVAPSGKKGAPTTTTTMSSTTSLNPGHASKEKKHRLHGRSQYFHMYTTDKLCLFSANCGGGVLLFFMFLADLRRPRSEPSNYYSSEGQRDLPLAKKHKPNPELFHTQPDKAASVPLSLEQQQLTKLSPSTKSMSTEGLSADKGHPTGGSIGTSRWPSRESFSCNNLGRKVLGISGGSSLGREKLANRLRQRDQLGMLVMTDREMADSELLSYREDLENQACLTQMDDLQVSTSVISVSQRSSLRNKVSIDPFRWPRQLSSNPYQSNHSLKRCSAGLRITSSSKTT